MLVRAGGAGRRGYGGRDAVALLVTRAMRSVLFEVAPADVVTYVAVLAVVLVVVAVAAYVPARRAARADPRELLKQE